MRASDRSIVAVTVAVALASLTLRPLTMDAQYLGLSWVLIVIIGGLTALLRRARVGPATTFAVQVGVLLVAVALLSWTLGEEELAPWEGGLAELIRSGALHMQTQSSPMEPNSGVTLMFVAAVGLVMVLTDLLVSGVGRPGWAFAPPTALYLVPALGLVEEASVLSFVLVAVGYLAILIADGLNANARWTRGLSHDSSEAMGDAAPVVWRAAGYLVVPALIVTVVVSMIAPTISLSGFGFGGGSGGNGPLQLGDPTLDLRRNLTQGARQPIISYRSTSGQNNRTSPTYLRLTTLPQFSGAGWTPVQIQVTPGNTLGSIPGLSVEPGPRRVTEVRVEANFESEYLPAPYAPRTFNAGGEWGFDPGALSILAMGSEDIRRSQVAGLSYSVESVDINPTSEQLSLAPAGSPTDASITSVVPPDLPQSLIELTNDVTEGSLTGYERAAAIQAYLRSGRYTYDTRPLPGSGYQALENFLLRDRRGYCEQFAGAMAMMARVAGIPSRVTIGFLPGEPARDGSYVVTNHEMHAWPELYFSGHGWVRFEPTPASQAGEVPAWSIPPTDNGGGNEPSVAPSEQPTEEPNAPSTAPSEAPIDAPTGPTEGGLDPVRVLAGVGIGVVVLLLVATPAALRLRRRSHRLDPDQGPSERVEGAWRELRDTVVDLGGRWPQGSPRTIGASVAEGLEPEQAQQLSSVAVLVERSRYARDPGAAVDDLPALTHSVRAGLAEPESRWRKVRATLLPRSLLNRPTD